MKRNLLIATAILVGLISPSPSFAAGPPDIRVMVIDEAAAISIDGFGFELKMGNVGSRKKSNAGKRIIIRAGTNGLIANGKNSGKAIAISSRERSYQIGDRTFAGELYIYLKAPERLIVVDHLPLEKYLVGLVGSEISPSWPIESIKSQVVAARTYAMNRMAGARRASPTSQYDLTSTVSSQVYHGSHVEDRRAMEAVKDTSGEVMYKNGKIFAAYYHSCCGGRTEHAHNVWDGETGPPVAEGEFCKRSPKFRWRHSIPVTAFVSRLNDYGVPLDGVTSVATTTFSDSPRIQMVLLEDSNGLQMVEAKELRRIFGYMNIKSTWFDVTLKRGVLDFSGNGYGHGVGMCQWGSKGMAEAGHDYRKILKFYYADASISRAY